MDTLRSDLGDSIEYARYCGILLAERHLTRRLVGGDGAADCFAAGAVRIGAAGK